MSTVRYTLQTDDDSVTFGTEKVSNWDELEPNLIRSKSYRGRVRKITNTFSFVDNIREKLISLFDKKETDNVKFKIQIGNDNREAFSYTDLGNGFPMVADFSKIQIDELTCQLNFSDSDFQQKITDKEKEKLNITMAETLTGEVATDYNSLLKTIWMHDRTLELNSRYDFEPIELQDLGEFTDPLSSDRYSQIPTKLIYRSDDDIKNIIPNNVDDENATELYFFLKSEEDKQLNLELSIDFNLSLRYANILANNPLTVNLVYRVIDDQDNEIYKEVLDSVSYEDGGTPTPSLASRRIQYSGVKDEYVLEGYSVGVYIEYKPPGIYFIQERSFTNNIGDKYIFVNSISYFAPTISNCILPHEFFTHWIELMTGKKNAFYSDFFGRTELGYTQDGEQAYFAIMDGHMIRNLPIEENPFNATFKDVLEDMIKIFNLVGQIEYKGNTEVFRIEPYNDVFNQQTIIDLGELVNGVERSQNNDITYNKIRAGYKDLVPENLNGLGIYNGEVNYSLPISGIDNELDLVVKGIAADYIIEQTRRKQFSVAPDEDTKYDKNIFYIEAKKGSTTDVLAKRNEDFESVTGILAPENAYNLGITPANIVRNWGGVVKGCLLNINGATLTLTKSASNNTLITKKAGQDEVNEGANIEVSELDNPIIVNESFSIDEAPLNKEQWDLIEENPNGIVKFVNKGIPLYSFIEKASYKQPNETGNFELTRANR